MNTLPVDVSRYLLEFVGNEDQVRMIDSSSIYVRHLKRAVRKVRLTNLKVHFCHFHTQILADILSLMEDPEKQLLINFHSKEWNSAIFPFQKICTLYDLELHIVTGLFLQNPDLKIGTYRISNTKSPTQNDMDVLARMCEVGAIQNLEINDYLFSRFTAFPYFPNVKSLVISGRSIHTLALPPSYSSHLQKLVLEGLRGIDVSSLDHIPDLTICSCRQIKGIACLKNNRRVSLSHTDIFDLSYLFCNSEEIFFSCSDAGPVTVDFSHWKEVRTLTLTCSDNLNRLPVIKNEFPSTLKRCYFGGLLLGEIMKLNPFPLQLLELTLSSSENITSLQGLGLHNISVLKLCHLYNLTSLQGLGGRNKKVTVRRCDKIEDFSVLRSVDTVIIGYCQGFRDVSQVNEVKKLSLDLMGMVENFDMLIGNIEELSISDILLISSYFPVLTKIPHLTILDPFADGLETFLSFEQGFQNQSITIDFKQRVNVQEFYERYLSAHYHYFVIRDMKEDGVSEERVRFVRKNSTM